MRHAITVSLLAAIVTVGCNVEVPPAAPLGYSSQTKTSGPNVDTARTTADGSYDVQVAATSGLPDQSYVQFLTQKGAELAEAELAKFASIEELYKNEVAFYQNVDHPIDPNSGLYTKWYRDYQGYRITDIMRSYSFLRPVIIEITYDYHYVHTPYHTTFERDTFRDIDPQKLAEEETEYKTDPRTYSIVRRYPCNRYGEYDGSLSNFPNRNAFPSPRRPVMIEGWSPITSVAAQSPVLRGGAATPAPSGGAMPGLGGMSPAMPGGASMQQGGAKPQGFIKSTPLPSMTGGFNKEAQGTGLDALLSSPPPPGETDKQGQSPNQPAAASPPAGAPSSAAGGALQGVIELNEENMKMLQQMVMDAAQPDADKQEAQPNGETPKQQQEQQQQQ